MTQEDKEVLLKDLLGSVLYGVNVDYHTSIFTLGYNLFLNNSDVAFENYPMLYFLENIESVKPYLRPMSSMTEEELKDLLAYSGIREHEIEICKYDGGAELEFWLSEVPCKCVGKVIDWLNQKMFDYRGLIPKNLALKAPDDMYKDE